MSLRSVFRTALSALMPRVRAITFWVTADESGDSIHWRYRLSPLGTPNLILLDGGGALDATLDSTSAVNVRRLTSHWTLAFWGRRSTWTIEGRAHWSRGVATVTVPAALPSPLLLATLGGEIPEPVMAGELPTDVAAASVRIRETGRAVAVSLARTPHPPIDVDALSRLVDALPPSRQQTAQEMHSAYENLQSALGTSPAASLVLSETRSEHWLTTRAPGIVELPDPHDASSVAALTWQLSALWWGGLCRASGPGGEHLTLTLRLATLDAVGRRAEGLAALSLVVIEQEVARLRPEWRALLDPSVRDARPLARQAPSDLLRTLNRVLSRYAGRAVPAARLRRELNL